MANKKLTAVEWLIDRIYDVDLTEEMFEEIKEQALELEKEQIISAYRKGSDNAVNVYIENGNNIPAKKYFKQTYVNN